MIKSKPLLLLVVLLVLISVGVLYFIHFNQFVPSSSQGRYCGNDILEKEEQCEKASDCTQVTCKTASCDQSCQCQYSTVEQAPTGTVCGNNLVEGGEDCDPPG